MVDLIGKLFTEGFIYLFLYLWLFLIAILESCKEFSRYKMTFAICTVIFLIFFTGSRWETGTDWPGYYTLFNSVEFNWTFLLNVVNFDLGYVLFNALVKLFTDNYTIFLLIDSFIALGLVFIFLRKYSPNPNLSLFVFYNTFFVSQFMGSNRRIIAMGAILFSFYCIYEGKKVKYAFWYVLGVLFHSSSFLTIFSWLIPRKRLSTRKTLIILILALAIGLPELLFKSIGLIGNALSVFGGSLIVQKILFYTNSNNEITIGKTDPVMLMTLSIIKRSIFLVFYFTVIKKNKGILDPLTDFFFNLYITGFAMYMLLNGGIVFQVASAYFTFVEIVLIGRFWVYTDKNLKITFFSVLLIYGFFQLLSALNAYPELYMPYKAFFS